MNDRTNGAPGKGHDNDAEKISAAKAGGSRAQERIAALDTKGAALSARVEELEAQLTEASRRVEEAEAGWQRARADYTNLKRRVEEERIERADFAADRLLGRVLELADDFDLAVEHVPADVRETPWVEGIRAIDRKLRALLEAEGVSPMGDAGEPFDPHTQQAISYEDTADVPDGTVLRVLKRGYTIRDRVLRPALVAVARNDDAPTPATHASDDQTETRS